MGVISLIICIVCYIATAIEFVNKRDWAMALVFAAYAVANVGFIWALRTTGK